MPYPVSNLIESRGEPLSVNKDDMVVKAISAMLEHDYSQLPVVDDENHPLGMITYESILRAIRNFKAALDDLKVANAMEVAEDFDLEDDIFDLLKALQDANAVLITGAGNQLIGIVTTYDTTEYFRRRSEDLMIIEEIESIIKEMIELYYLNDDGEVKNEELQSAVDLITDRSEQRKNKLKTALYRYFNLSKNDFGEIDVEAFEKSFLNTYKQGFKKNFNQLSLGEFIELLLHGDRWDYYQEIFQVDAVYIRNLLDEVRKTRNHLAHFKGEISPDQRENLEFCFDWMSGIHEEAFRDEELEGVKDVETISIDQEEGEDYIAPVGEETTGRTSKYAPLGEFLQGIPGKQDRIRLSFENIEEIIGDELPPSAYQHRTWWANDTVGHVQSKHWLSAGWKVGYRNMTSHEVTFSRIKERERQYIRFFGPLKTRLDQELDLPLKDTTASGTHWLGLIKVPESGNQRSIIPVGFANQDRYRIELYIDTGDRNINKAIFDELKTQRLEIESDLGQKLGWERLDEKRASRIALYNTGSIEDDQEKLNELQDWTVEWLPKFYEAIFERASQTLKSHTS